MSSESVQELVPGALDIKERGIQEKIEPLSQAAKAAETERRRKVRVGMMMSIGK